MVTPENVIFRSKLKVQIMSEIERVVTSVLNDIDTPKSEETKSLTASSIPSNCVLNFLFSRKDFSLATRRQQHLTRICATNAQGRMLLFREIPRSIVHAIRNHVSPSKDSSRHPESSVSKCRDRSLEES